MQSPQNSTVDTIWKTDTKSFWQNNRSFEQNARHFQQQYDANDGILNAFHWENICVFKVNPLPPPIPQKQFTANMWQLIVPD